MDPRVVAIYNRGTEFPMQKRTLADLIDGLDLGLARVWGSRSHADAELQSLPDGLVLDAVESLIPDGESRSLTVHRVTSVTCSERGRMPGLPAALFAPMSIRVSGPIQRHEGEVPEGDEPPAEDPYQIEGIASSTSKDWYGTEMAKSALDQMEAQFVAGVSLTPRHNGWWSVVEWDEVIGLTNGARIERAEVANPSEPLEPGYLLYVQAGVYVQFEQGAQLRERVKAEQPIGLSIGGWFTDVRIISDEDTGEVLRIIILAVELDHLAVTRSPANPDAMGLQAIRSRLARAIGVLDDPEEMRPTGGVAQAAVRTALDDGTGTRVADAKAARASAEIDGGADNPDSGNPAPEMDTAPEADDTRTNDGGPVADPIEDTEDAMSLTAEQIRSIMGEALSPLTTRLDAIEARTAEPIEGTPIDTADADELARLRTQNEALRQRVSSAATSGRRRSLVPDHAYAPGQSGDGSQFRSLVDGARDEGRALAIAECSERHARILTAETDDTTVKRGQCERALRDMINAAVLDGVIKDPSDQPAWG